MGEKKTLKCDYVMKEEKKHKSNNKNNNIENAG
jgi:hypothetical protein